MTTKLSRRELLKLAAAGAAAAGVGVVPQIRMFAAPPRQSTVTLRFQEDQKQYAKVVEAWNAKNPNVKIEFVNVTGVDHAEVASKILAQLAAGQPVDIGFAATEATQLYAGEGLADALTKRVQDSKAVSRSMSSSVRQTSHRIGAHLQAQTAAYSGARMRAVPGRSCPFRWTWLRF